MLRQLALFALSMNSAWAQSGSVDDIKQDQVCEARTVFRGDQPETFPVKILGVLQRSGPGQNVILARLQTPRLEQTGVMQGMSGSPVVCAGKLIGAIAFAFPFAKEPIAGIRPIGEMLNAAAPAASAPTAQNTAFHLASTELPLPPRNTANGVPTEVLTPISFSGLTANATRHFTAAWERLGFAVQQGTGGASTQSSARPLQPGDMISVQLMRGDLVAGADGTVTHIAGKRVYAFGHRFLGGGQVDFPFAKAEVITPLPNWNTSFKISQSLHSLGAIRLDADAAITGELGAQAKLVPLKITYRDATGTSVYRSELVRHNVLTPLLLQMAVYSTLDHHFRSAGTGTVDLTGTIRYAPTLPAMQVSGRYAGDANLPLGASLGAAIPAAFVQLHAVESILPESIEINLLAQPNREQWAVERLSLNRRTAKPGDRIDAQILLATGDGREQRLTHTLTLPEWLTPGETLTVTVTDALSTNLLDYRSLYQPGGPTFQNGAELIQTVNALHPANSLHLRVLRTAPGFLSSHRDLGNLPPSIAASMQRSPGEYLPTYQSRIAAREFLLASGVAGGAKTITLEIEK